MSDFVKISTVTVNTNSIVDTSSITTDTPETISCNVMVPGETVDDNNEPKVGFSLNDAYLDCGGTVWSDPAVVEDVIIPSLLNSDQHNLVFKHWNTQAKNTAIKWYSDYVSIRNEGKTTPDTLELFKKTAIIMASGAEMTELCDSHGENCIDITPPSE